MAQPSRCLRCGVQNFPSRFAPLQRVLHVLRHSTQTPDPNRAPFHFIKTHVPHKAFFAHSLVILSRETDPVYTQVYADGYSRQEVIGALLAHAGSGAETEADAALDALVRIVPRPTTKSAKAERKRDKGGHVV
jgi:hypothetical protein